MTTFIICLCSALGRFHLHFIRGVQQWWRIMTHHHFSCISHAILELFIRGYFIPPRTFSSGLTVKTFFGSIYGCFCQERALEDGIKLATTLPCVGVKWTGISYLIQLSWSLATLLTHPSAPTPTARESHGLSRDLTVSVWLPLLHHIK